MGQGKAKRDQHTLPKERWWCIWCDGRPEIATFRTREHVIAESLGGHRNYRLQRGVVCDRCNRGILQAIDEEMLLIGPVRFVRAHFGLGPRFTHVTGGVVIDRDKDLVTVDATKLGRGTTVSFTGYADRTGTIRTTFAGPSDKVRSEHFTRGLHRIAYNALAFHLGAEQTRDAFGYLRALVLDLEAIQSRAFLLDEQAILKAMQAPKKHWESRCDVLTNSAGEPDVVLVQIGPWPCLVSVADTTAPLRRLLSNYPWLKASTRLDDA
jgi:hypothetical protein